MKRSDLKKMCRPAGRLLLLALAWTLGTGAAFLREHFTEKEAAPSAAPASASVGTGWGLKFHEDGQRPDGNSTMEELAAHNAFYVQDTEEKVLYLTFDCGYENGNTEPILDALKKHGAEPILNPNRNWSGGWQTKGISSGIIPGIIRISPKLLTCLSLKRN